MKKGTKLYSIITSTCPACNEGKIYPYGPYKVSHMTKINKRCSVCQQSFEPEPSFYTGSMYVGYAFSVAIVVSVFVAFNVLFDDPSVSFMMFMAISLAVLFAPLNFRLSRNIWLNLFVSYKKK